MVKPLNKVEEFCSTVTGVLLVFGGAGLVGMIFVLIYCLLTGDCGGLSCRI